MPDKEKKKEIKVYLAPPDPREVEAKSNPWGSPITTDEYGNRYYNEERYYNKTRGGHQGGIIPRDFDEFARPGLTPSVTYGIVPVKDQDYQMPAPPPRAVPPHVQASLDSQVALEQEMERRKKSASDVQAYLRSLVEGF